MKRLKIILLTTAVSALFLGACSKSKDNSTLQIRLTDAPTSLEEVNVEIREVEVRLVEPTRETEPTRENTQEPTRINENFEGWVRLETNSRVYNLLELQNGATAELASASIPRGTVTEIRFVLGTNNSIRENGVTYPLEIPSGSSSGLKIKVDKQLNAEFETLTIDFDAAMSVKKEGTGDFKLRPVLRLK
jgi:hypothetical protein